MNRPSIRKAVQSCNKHLTGSKSSVSGDHVSIGPQTRCLASAPSAKKLNIERDVLLSVLEASATKRDAKSYLQKYASKQSDALSATPQFLQNKESEDLKLINTGSNNVAIVKIRTTDTLDDSVLAGLAKTFAQLRHLGLLSVVVLDSGSSTNFQACRDQAYRLSEAIDRFEKPGSKVAGSIFHQHPKRNTDRPNFLAEQITVDDAGMLQKALSKGLITIIPPFATPSSGKVAEAVDADQLVLALTRYFSGLQLNVGRDSSTDENSVKPVKALASVERVIVLDSFGGVPVPGHPEIPHRFINLEQEFKPLTEHFTSEMGNITAQTSLGLAESAKVHAANLRLARESLAILPSTSSVLITTPTSAANITQTSLSPEATSDPTPGFQGMVTTRKKQNPLLYNLLTDKPVYSSSLPIQRMQPGSTSTTTQGTGGVSGTATLVKRGMPVTIFPDPRVTPWLPPKPGSPRLRLTDRCIDMPRLQHLIEDSFNRKIDMQNYLDRVNENIAGVIIAGQYEGGAILTWERPEGMSEEEAYEKGCMVPYLDKFAVLKRSQGAGGVADIVFNAMVQDCFPKGVCWRSRKDNPVNKWYFERSAGTRGLSGTNWRMFWTTPGVTIGGGASADYEAVCRAVQPSWADNKHILE